MNRAFDLSSIGGIPSTSCRVIGTTQFYDLSACRVLHHIGAGDEVGVSQTHLTPHGQTEILLGWALHEILALNIELTTERHLAHTRRLVFRVVNRVEFLNLVFGVVLDHDF